MAGVKAVADEAELYAFSILTDRARDLAEDARRQLTAMTAMLGNLGVGEANVALACVCRLEQMVQRIDIASITLLAARLRDEHPGLFCTTAKGGSDAKGPSAKAEGGKSCPQQRTTREGGGGCVQ
jgi:hypothetical protein